MSRTLPPSIRKDGRPRGGGDMSTDTMEGRQRWGVAAGVALAFAVTLAVLFRAPQLVSPVAPPPPRALELRHIAGGQGAESDEATLRDLTPLFLPTDRNATLGRLPVREAGQVFLDVAAPRLGIAEASWRFDRDLPPVVTFNGSPLNRVGPLDYLDLAAQEAGAVGFGREPKPVAALQPRGGLLEVVRMHDGQRVILQELPLATRPQTDKIWQPVDFVASVGPAGLRAPLTITTRSGVDEVDSFFRNFLARQFRVGDVLAPGFYRITVAP